MLSIVPGADPGFSDRGGAEAKLTEKKGHRGQIGGKWADLTRFCQK